MSGSIATLIFARCDSSRLPGKVLLPINGRPMLGRVIDRLRRARRAGKLMIATSVRPIDDPLVAFAADEGLGCFRGALDDVAGRALACAAAAGAPRFIRISGDSPFIDPVLLDEMVELHERSGAELTTNLHPRTFPPGVSIEVVETAALGRLIDGAPSAEEREHVTLHFYQNAGRYRIVNHAVAEDLYAGASLVVDTEGDLRRAVWITERLGAKPEAASLRQVVDLARQWQAEAA